MKNRVEKTKEKIKDAFIELYDNNNIENISIKDITNMAGFNRGTFYIHYNDIYDLLDEIEDEVLSEHKKITLNIINDNSLDLMQFFTLGVEKNLELIINKQKYYKTLLLRNNLSFEEKIKNEMKEGILCQCNDSNKIKKECIIEMLGSANIALIKYWLRTDMKLSKEEILSISKQFAMNNLLFWEN